MAQQRRFTGRQRVALYLASGGVCTLCGTPLQEGWHADHIQPWIHSGATDVMNGQALCPKCNMKKGASMDAGKSVWPANAREWQLQAWDQYLRDQKKDWLLCATPGAGKTNWALHLARYLLDNGTIERVVVVAPTQTVRDQWAQGSIVHLDVVLNEHGGTENSEDFEGCVVTYAQVASQPDLQRMKTFKRTLVIFDEIHHAGFPNRSWGDRATTAFEHATLRVGLTGTPWRRPGSGRIPFVSYVFDEKEGVEKVHVDFAYEYGHAVRDEVCRVLEFRAFDGEVKYALLGSCAAQAVSYSLEDEDDTTSVLRDLLKPDGAWMHSILQKAHDELKVIRGGFDGEDAIPDAKGLVIADAQPDAREIARQLERITGGRPEVIISDEPDSEAALERFKRSKGMWAVAVNKVSEGVDIPALYVGVYATRKKTPMIWRQILGRFVRRRVDQSGKPRPEEERPAVLFMPAVPTLKKLAEDIEEELRHCADVAREAYDRELQEQKERELGDDSVNEFIPIDVSPAELDTVIINGKTYTQAEYDRALEYAKKFRFRNDQITKVADMLREINTPPIQVSPSPSIEEPRVEISRRELRDALKYEVERRARRIALAKGIEFKEFNIQLVKRFGPRDQMPIRKLQEAIEYLKVKEIEE